MATETMDKLPTTDGTGIDNNDGPPIETSFPGADDDNSFRRQAQDGIAEIETMLGKPPASLTDGWEKRARNVQPGRGYEFDQSPDGANPHRRVIGGAALEATYGLGHRYSGMPHRGRNNPLGTFISRQSVRF